MNRYKIKYRKFEQIQQRNQLTTTLHFTIEEVFETLEIADVDM